MATLNSYVNSSTGALPIPAARSESPILREEVNASPVERTARRVSSVAREALKTQRRIISGKYHFEDNIIVVKVETKKTNSKGKVVEKTQEDIAYEVVGLSYKETGKEYVNVLGARTEAALSPIFKALFKALEEVEDVDPFLSTTLADLPESLDQANSVPKEHVKTLTFSHFQELGDAPAPKRGQPLPQRPILKDHVSMRIDNAYVGFKGQPQLMDTLEGVHFVNDQSLKDRTTLSQMLQAGEWKLMLKEAKDKTLTDNEWNFASDHLQQDYEGAMKALTAALYDEIEEEGELKHCYADQLAQQAQAMRKQLKPLRVDVLNLKQVKTELDAQIDELQKTFETKIDELNEMPYYRVLLASRREIREMLEDVSQHQSRLLNGARAAEDIQVLEFATKIRDQRKALGKASFGKHMTMDWFNLFDRYGFFEYSGDSHADFLKEKLEIYPQSEVDALSTKAKELVVKMRARFQLESELRGLEDFEEDDFCSALDPNEFEARQSAETATNEFASTEEEFQDAQQEPLILEAEPARAQRTVSPLSGTADDSHEPFVSERPAPMRPLSVRLSLPELDLSALSDEELAGLRLSDGALRTVRQIRDTFQT